MTYDEMIIKLGTALFDHYGQFCIELVDAGYDLDAYYDGGYGWGDFTKVLVIVSVLRGATNYDEYKTFYEANKGDGDRLASKQLFARLTKIYTPRTNLTQTDRTRTYRKKTVAELDELRTLHALGWIDKHLNEAEEYIKTKKKS